MEQQGPVLRSRSTQLPSSAPRGSDSVGVIVTRGPRLQKLIGPLIRSRDGGFKYGKSSTHWSKLVPRVNLGGGGQCPLLLVGIEPERIGGVELALEARRLLDESERIKAHWQAEGFASRSEVVARARSMKEEALALLPPVSDVQAD